MPARTYTLAQRKAWGAKMQAAKTKTTTKRKMPKKAYPTKKSMSARKKAPVKEKSYFERTLPYLSAIGHGATKALAGMITGFGDYRIGSNSLLTGGITPPTIMNSMDKGGVIIRHREYMGDVLPSTNFNINTYSINPGLFSTFPWLSQVAANFEQYRFRGLIFEFKSLSSDAVLSTAANTSLGSVIMATQYNALSTAFTDKKTMENYEFANSSKPSECFIHPIECKASQTPVSELYVRTGGVPTGADARLFDLGDFNLATVGMQGTTGVIGELWCTFEVEFYKSKLITADGLGALTDHWQLSGLSGGTGGAFLGTTSTKIANNIGTTIDTTGTILTFPATITNGMWLVNYLVKGTSTALTTPPTISFNASCTTLNYWNGLSAPTPNNWGTTFTTGFILFVVTINTENNGGIPATFTITNGTMVTSPTSGDLVITQINPNSD